MSVELLEQHVYSTGIVTHARGAKPASVDDWPEFVRRQRFMGDIYRLLDRARDEREVQASVPGNAYIVNTGASAIALVAATAKTIFYINVGASNQPSVVELVVGFDGVTASAVPALVELCYGTAASNSTPGTASTSFTPLQSRGWPGQTSQNAAANACTSEPTVLTSQRQWLVTPNGGLLIMQFPMGREPTGLVTAATSGKQLAVRVTAPAVVNARGFGEYEE